MLNNETATSYILNKHNNECEIVSVCAANEAIEAIDVTFVFNGFTFTATVWIECGEIYGEW